MIIYSYRTKEADKRSWDANWQKDLVGEGHKWEGGFYPQKELAAGLSQPNHFCSASF